MKKVLSLVLALLMLASLCACAGGGEKEPAESKAPAASPSEAAPAESKEPAPADSPSAEGTDFVIEEGMGWDIVNAADKTQNITASSISKDLAAKAGVSTVGWFTDDVDWFGRDAYKIAYMRMSTMTIHTSFVDALRKDWIPRVNFTLDEYDASSDIDNYINTLELYCMQGYDGLILDPDPSANLRVLDICKENDMPWMPAWQPITDADGLRIYPGVSLDSAYCGYKQTEWMADNYEKYWGEIDTTKLGMIFIYASFNQNFIENEEGAKDFFVERFPEAAANYYVADCLAEAVPISAEAGSNQTSIIMTAHPEVEYWFVTSCLEDYGQGAARAAEQLGFDKKTIVVTNGANILIPAWKDGTESGTCWKAGLHYGMNMFGENIICGLIALIEERATPETLYYEWHREGEHAANVRCDWRVVCEEDYQEYLDYIDAYLAA